MIDTKLLGQPSSTWCPLDLWDYNSHQPQSPHGDWGSGNCNPRQLESPRLAKAVLDLIDAKFSRMWVYDQTFTFFFPEAWQNLLSSIYWLGIVALSPPPNADFSFLNKTWRILCSLILMLFSYALPSQGTAVWEGRGRGCELPQPTQRKGGLYVTSSAEVLLRKMEFAIKVKNNIRRVWDEGVSHTHIIIPVAAEYRGFVPFPGGDLHRWCSLSGRNERKKIATFFKELLKGTGVLFLACG